MATCTSRRACADRFSFRLYKIIDGKTCLGRYIWTEFRCLNIVSNDKTCIECAVKLPKYKYQANSKCDHGFVDGPYPSDSRLYGSPYYLKQSKDGWMIYEADENRAKEAQLNSSMTKKIATVPPIPAVDAPIPSVVVPTIVAKKPRKVRVAKHATEIALALPVKAVESVASVPAQFVEALSVPIKVSDIRVVKVKKIHTAGKDYYFDSNSGKIYTVLVNGVGAYKGRYDSESNEISSYPDSDVEV